MTQNDWLKILEADKQKDWEWYARWLLDEKDDQLRALAITKYLINKSPRFSKLTNSYDWWISSHTDGNDVDDIEDEIFKNLYNRKRIFCEYNSILEAKLGLIEAWVLSKMGM
jgi:hypothetical protein